MKGLRILVVILALMTGLSAQSPLAPVGPPKPADKWLALDKLKHFSTSFYLTTTAFYGQNRILDEKSGTAHFKSATLTISLGILKEIRDSRQKGNIFSWRDLAADALGAGAALLLLGRIE
jgi:uncharacterized protein YfiM (DUF2279 family)